MPLGVPGSKVIWTDVVLVMWSFPKMSSSLLERLLSRVCCDRVGLLRSLRAIAEPPIVCSALDPPPLGPFWYPEFWREVMLKKRGNHFLINPCKGGIVAVMIARLHSTVE